VQAPCFEKSTLGWMGVKKWFTGLLGAALKVFSFVEVVF
jgi:hypothetical protein